MNHLKGCIVFQKAVENQWRLTGNCNILSYLVNFHICQWTALQCIYARDSEIKITLSAVGSCYIQLDNIMVLCILCSCIEPKELRTCFGCNFDYLCLIWEGGGRVDIWYQSMKQNKYMISMYPSLLHAGISLSIDSTLDDVEPWNRLAE